jgi:hypothetical protein
VHVPHSEVPHFAEATPDAVVGSVTEVAALVEAWCEPGLST